ncbi:unnamed protein product [Symbiodinium natans]|uniref:Uncharacterized protein n=1 Tax=Symbiodinium natans TaxID=878477 RepID=A0A812MKT5_9DINO|nr:unnamed protein product [Symbiodinium natans]
MPFFQVAWALWVTESQPDWSHAHALHALAHCLLAAAGALGRSLEGAGQTGLNDYDFFHSNAAAARMGPCTTQGGPCMESNTARAIAALDENDIPALAEALAAWVEDPREEDLPWLQESVGPVAKRVLSACQEGMLGCAWRSSDEGRGSPHCLLGAGGAVQDKDLNALRKAAATLRQASQAHRASPPCPGATPTAPAAFTFRRSILVYPEEMMFFMVRCGEQKGVLQTVSPPLAESCIPVAAAWRKCFGV